MIEITLKIKLNEPQLESFKEVQKKFKGSHFANMTIRKDGKNHTYEVDYLKDAFIEADI